MSAYTLKMLEDKQARAYATIVASLPLELRADAKGLTYKYIAPRACTTCATLSVPCHISLRPPQTTTGPMVPLKRMELSWDDDADSTSDGGASGAPGTYTGAQHWILFPAAVCECCAVTSAFCSAAGRVLAFSCLPRHARTWSWCLVQECVPYWPRALHEIGRKSLGVVAAVGWGEENEALSEWWRVRGRLRQVGSGGDNGAESTAEGGEAEAEGRAEYQANGRTKGRRGGGPGRRGTHSEWQQKWSPDADQEQ